MSNTTLLKWATLHSLGVFIYASAVAIFMSNGEKLFGKSDNFATLIIILMLFVVSAAIVGSLIIAKPIFLYLDGQKKEAVKLLLYTISSLFIITVLSVLIYSLVR